MTPPLLVLAIVVFAGFTVEAAIGFGATLVIVALASLVMATPEALARVVPLNVLLSLAIVLRAPRAVDVGTLLRRILPVMLLGLPLGFLAVRALPERRLAQVFALFVLVLATAELAAMARSANKTGPSRPLSATARTLLLLLGGVAHGALASGGPPIVYVCARSLPDKTVFRATMSALWLVCNVALVGIYLVDGRVTTGSLRDSAPLVVPLVCGIAAGEALHHHVSERAFRLTVFILLFVVAVVLAVRA